jgi:hypothetical protein
MNMPINYGEINSGDQSFGARLPYLVDGDFNLEISKVQIRGRKEPFYIVEVDVLESNTPDRPAGAKCVAMIDLTKVDTRGKHICSFIAAAFGYDPLTLPKNSVSTPWDGQSWNDYMNWTSSEQNPLAKRRVRCNVTTTKTQAGGDFSLHTWSVFDPQAKLPPRVVQQYAPQGAPTPGVFAAPGAPQGGGFQAPPPQPNAAPQGFQQGGFQAPMPAQGQPLGGFAPPGVPAMAPSVVGMPGMPGQPQQGQPPAGWGGGAPMPQQGFQQPQGGFQPQQPPQGGFQPQQPQGGFQGPWNGQQR